MNTAEFLLRKHFPTGQSQEKRLLLSLGDEEIAYGIYPEIERSEPGKDFVNVIPDVVENGCLAGIYTSNGSVFLEAFSAVEIKSEAGTFARDSTNGFMPVQIPRSPGTRTRIQVRPGDIVSLGRTTLSFEALEPASTGPVLSEYDAQSEQVTQALRSQIVKQGDLIPCTPSAKEQDIAQVSNQSVRNEPAGASRTIMDTMDRKVRTESATADDDNIHASEDRSQDATSLHYPAEPKVYQREDDTQNSMFQTNCVNVPAKTADIDADQPHGAAGSPVRLDREQVDYAADSTVHHVERAPAKPSSKKRKRATATPSPVDSSARNLRSSIAREEYAITESGVLKIIFASSSTVKDSAAFKRFLKSHGVTIVGTVQESTALCVGRDELKKTCKMIMAILLGKPIITDNWVTGTDSVKAQTLLGIEKYRATDTGKEKQWGISLQAAIMRGKQRSKPLDGWSIIFTPAAKKEAGTSGFKELKELATMAGANQISAALPKKSADETPKTLIITGSSGDPSRERLEPSWRCFSHEIVGLSILRGKVEISSDEFLVPVTHNHDEENRGRKRQRQ